MKSLFYLTAITLLITAINACKKNTNVDLTSTLKGTWIGKIAGGLDVPSGPCTISFQDGNKITMTTSILNDSPYKGLWRINGNTLMVDSLVSSVKPSEKFKLRLLSMGIE